MNEVELSEEDGDLGESVRDADSIELSPSRLRGDNPRGLRGVSFTGAWGEDMNEVELSEGDDDLAGTRGLRANFAIRGFGNVGIGGFCPAVDEVELVEEGVDECVSVDGDSIELPPGDRELRGDVGARGEVGMDEVELAEEDGDSAGTRGLSAI